MNKALARALNEASSLTKYKVESIVMRQMGRPFISTICKLMVALCVLSCPHVALTLKMVAQLRSHSPNIVSHHNKQAVRFHPQSTSTATIPSQAEDDSDILVRALRGQSVRRPPVWMLRQVPQPLLNYQHC
jgi:hypothetical protein